MKKLAIFGSGVGSNAENICDYFKNSSDIEVVLICTNNKDAFIVNRAKKLNIPLVFTSKTGLLKFDDLAKTLKNYDVDYIILAGFLLKIPSRMISTYPNKIINLHPSLLPKYGGKGMYGSNVHKAVLENKEIQ
ncbi:MAG: formyltransferase family protein, partial [Flavobacteriales bacterium]|nr:formyltransferase family protein [Flavobacteriales bacterium]